MYRFYINNVDNDYHYSELARVFLPEDLFEVIPVYFDKPKDLKLGKNSFIINSDGFDQRDFIKKEFYNVLSSLCDIDPGWGTLTGVRPLKIAFNIYNKSKSVSSMNSELKDVYLLSEDKILLLDEILKYQLDNISRNSNNEVGLYIGIPFCPTRCEYCSFASNVATPDRIEEYLLNLLKEIEYMGDLIKEHGTVIESLYIGGGTPTTLSAKQLDLLLNTIEENLSVNPNTIEFTIEGGRPDTLSEDKLEVMHQHGINRISINPQSMKAETLQLIGRSHTPEQIVQTYKLAANYGFDVINADLIAGLQDESLEDFKYSLDKMIELGANNITVHTLSVKRGSRLKDRDPEYYRRNTELVAAMLAYAHDTLIEQGYSPYYIYKQKHQIGAFENVGYCKPGSHSIYNIRIMEEKQTIIALGAGGIGKVYYPEEDRLERIPNVSNYEVYNERFEDILLRKNNYYGGNNGY